MRFSISATVLILSSIICGVTSIPTALRGNVLNKRSWDDLYVDTCGGALSGEVTPVYLGNGVAPYTLTAQNSTDGSLIAVIDTGITESRHIWETGNEVPVGAGFYLQVTDATGAQAQGADWVMGPHPGRRA